ncbi:MAG: HD domain-containing protein [Candidatus Aminicenantes bacterium]|nr:HD domain-containing protein [Candidatus Aminicenantes bacterium]
MEITKPTRKDRQEDKEFAKTIEDIISKISAGVKTAQIYEPNNITFLKQANILYDLVTGLLKKEGEAVLLLRDNIFYINSIRVKLSFSSYHSQKFLSDELEKKAIGLISFEPGLEKKDMEQFLVLITKDTQKLKDPFDEIVQKMKTIPINHIWLEKLHPFGILARKEKVQIRKYAKKVFFKCIVYLNELFEKEQQNKRIRFKTTRRLMQSIIDLIVQDEAFMIGLTNIKNYSEYELNHSVNVSVLAACIGRRLGFEKNELLDLSICAFLHDIGKLDIPKEILEKPTALTPEEKKIIEKHPYFGAGKLARLSEVSSLPIISLHVALEHHLCNDLSGYPQCWKIEDTSLFSRIIKICDFFDAITTKRAYRDHALSRSNALSLMIERSGSEFDPILLKVFVKMIGIFPIGELIILNTGEIGIVMETNPEEEHITRPKVQLITDADGNKINGELIDLAEIGSEEVPQRFIHKSLDPDKYDINVADYFLAEA